MVVLNWNIVQEMLVVLREKTLMLYLGFFCVVLGKQRVLFVDDAVEAKFHDYY